MQNTNRSKLLMIIGGIWLAIMLLNSFSSNAVMKTLPYSEFLKLAKEGKISEVAVTDNVIQGVMLDENSNSGRVNPFERYVWIRTYPKYSIKTESNIAAKYNPILLPTFFHGFFPSCFLWEFGTLSCVDFNNNKAVL